MTVPTPAPGAQHDAAPGGGGAPFATTIINPESRGWTERATLIDRDALSIPAALREIVHEGRRHDASVLLAAVPARKGYVDLIAAGRLARAPESPLIVMSECTWELGSDALSSVLGRVLPGLGGRIPLDGLTRRLIGAMDGPRTIYCVLSDAERDLFIPTWGIDPARVVVTPFAATLSPSERDEPIQRGDYVFSGGDPLRDYDLLADAAVGLGAEVRIATRHWAPEDPERLAPNVTAGLIPHDEYVSTLRSSAAVAVPLRGDAIRGAGQATFLNAMASRKPVVITDGVGVREYLTHEEHAIIVPTDDPRAMHQALAWVLDPANSDAVDAMVGRAESHIRAHFQRRQYEDRLMAVVDHYLEHLEQRPEPG